ncbi:amino acid adenylation domain-containing protein [Nonomuraea sp. NBC_01738]|uniref:non-ribosomal peptide synthetase n=1 Tax=Nonomuraea sp. NBC_01738 TaxID=2976003 RepID=UPI002E112039|nr:non-ribosomal peptide synthetase [Nonomuraea sp. NBC_01738]WSG11939.1 amino acid adenylation domain-containing protein [Nonomuraea sp. NBC_01738]
MTAWTQGPAHTPPDGLLGDLIVAQAGRTPDAPAVRQWDVTLSYVELVAAASALAGRLRGLGVGPEARVGLCVRRTPLMPVAVLGVLLAGGVYVPLDPGHPPRRLDEVLNDAGITVVVTDAAGEELLADSGRTLVTPELKAEAEPVVSGAVAENAAYVLYTSGSTGRPKGVVVSHRNAVAFVTASIGHFGLDASCRSVAFSALGFDVSVLDMIAPLASGGCVQLVPDDDRVDPGRLQAFLEEHRVTWGFVPPALLPLVEPSRLPYLADLVTAGEPPGPEQVARWGAVTRFHNWYGPTETTVCVVGGRLEGVWERALPIGRPLAGCRAHVLDEEMRECPPGVAGELYIGGPQVTRGYLGRPGMTAERFVPDPFSGEPGARLYRTGDHVAWEDDGRISFMGRLDRQVKVQGQRVEIGEVESALRGHPLVSHAVVVYDGELVAYVTPEAAPGLEALRAHCGERLPSYMLPTRVVRLAALPLNASGKVDQLALRALREREERRRAEREDRGGDSARETGSGVLERVSRVWGRVLGVARPREEDDFFAEGGHSLRAMRIVAAVRAELGRDVSVEDLYACRTLGAFAAVVARAEGDRAGGVPQGSPATLSGSQRRMWFVERLAPASTAHNVAMAERLRGPLDVAALERALAAVVARHEALRWRVSARDGVPEVSVAPPGEVRLPLTVADEGGLRQVLADEAALRFELAAGPLWRARLVRLGNDHHVLCLTVHHLVFDGWSQDVLYRDLATAYQGDPLPPATTTLGDYVRWTRDRSSPESLTWWRAHLDGAPMVLDLPRDHPRPPEQTFRGAALSATLDAAARKTVTEQAARLGATPYAVLLSAFADLMARLGGQDELLVGAAYADRPHVAFDDLVGMCVQILPLRLAGHADPDERVTACAAELARAIAHPDVPLGRLIETLRLPRDLGRNPITQVLFNMYGFAQATLELPGCVSEPLRPGLPGALFDLTMYVSEDADGYALELVYNPDLFTAERMRALLDAYTATVRGAEPEPVAERELPAGEGPGLVELAGDAHRELRERTVAAIRLAGIEPGQVIAVLADRAPVLPGLLLGVLASGARWVVIDPAHPPAVQARQAAACGARAVLRCAGAAGLEELPEIVLGAERDASVHPERGYLSLTSGTTGEPKPVATTERPLAHFVRWYAETFGVSADDRFALLSGLAHDPALRDLFVPMATGARLCVPPQELIRDPVRLAAWLAAERVTVLHLTPQLATLLTGGGVILPDVRLAAVGGDRFTWAQAARLRDLIPHARLVAFYGTTETPQAHAWHELPEGFAPNGEPVPVGRAVEGSEILVLDRAGRRAAVGELGEVVVRSRHLATGYLNPGPGAGRFDGDRFHTGDLGRHNPDGTITLAGRRDGQVKVRGFRVELGEVESALAGCRDVRAAAAVARDDRLTGFVVAGRPGLSAQRVLEHARAVLPEHAVPAEVVLLPALPLTPNGKLDLAALKAAKPRASGSGELDGATQKAVAQVWHAVLGVPRLGPDDNFFEIGGHSLAIAEVQARLRAATGTEVAIVELFRHPTIRTLAAHLDGAAGDAPGLDRAARRLAVRRDRMRNRNERGTTP